MKPFNLNVKCRKNKSHLHIHGCTEAIAHSSKESQCLPVFSGCIKIDCGRLLSKSWKYLNPKGSLICRVIAMSDVVVLLKEIREELREIKLLYKGLVERLIPAEEPLKDEKKAIESRDEIISEKEIMEPLS